MGIRAASLSAGRPALEQRGRPVSLAAELVAQRLRQGRQGQQGLSRAQLGRYRARRLDTSWKKEKRGKSGTSLQVETAS